MFVYVIILLDFCQCFFHDFQANCPMRADKWTNRGIFCTMAHFRGGKLRRKPCGFPLRKKGMAVCKKGKIGHLGEKIDRLAGIP